MHNNSGDNNLNKNIYILLFAQFLTAFADNAILFTALAMAQQLNDNPPWYIPVLQGVFIAAFVVFAPWVGPFADSRPKATVLVNANLVKALGAGLMFLGIDPLLSYALVGAGAAMYAPAKYGILPELVAHDALVKANGWIESSTIIAILAGSIIGGIVADYSITFALGLIEILFLFSALAALFINKVPPRSHEPYKLKLALINFFNLTRTLLQTERARFCILGVAFFWAAAAALRVMLVAWAPLVLNIHDSGGIAKLTAFIAIGIAVGALLVSQLIPLEKLQRTFFAACGIGLAIVALYLIAEVWGARLALILVGLSGGLFIVPINAALQEIGHGSIGSGNTIAVQQFFESVGMMSATGIYALAAAQGANPIYAILILGLIVMFAAISYGYVLKFR